MRTQPKSIAEVLFPIARRRVLGVLFTDPNRELHLREIVRRVNLAPATVQREVVALAKAGILERRAEGRQVYYRANRACTIFAELRGMMLKTVGMADVLREALAPLGEKVKYAAVFGSIAEGTDMPESDVDLLVVGEVRLRDLAPLLRPAREALGREINVVRMSVRDFRAGAAQGDHFLSTVLARSMIAVKGDVDELRRPAEKPIPAGP
jgi:predicted nucleotidyltransferase